MILHLLPTRTAGAAENMALDFLLLQRYPDAAAARFRHYEWRRQAFTFGYSQKLVDVMAMIQGSGPNALDDSQALERGAYDLCRRPTGGGLVDHRGDWTYALVIPRGHPLEALRAAESYRAIHACIAEALGSQGVPARLEERGRLADDAGDGATRSLIPSVCFQGAEVHDVIHSGSGEKIAGAAQKRNKRGLLFQGSIWRAAAGAAVDWDRFEADFVAGLVRALGVEAERTPWPDLDEDEVSALVEKYSSPEWNEG